MPSSKTNNINIDWYDLLLLLIVAISFVSVFLLVFDKFKSANAILIGSSLSAALILVLRIHLCNRMKHLNPFLLLILLLALLFRYEPFLWLMGGQDQGLYVNMSAYYEKNGSTIVKDAVRASLDEDRKKIYDKNEHHYEGLDFNLEGEYPKVDVKRMKDLKINNLNTKHSLEYAIHLPGVFIKDLKNSEYVFQFYPLHSLWMAITGKILGSDNRVYSLTFFSLLTIVTFYLLGLELSGGNKHAGYLVAFFLAINPLHVFFSKLPVSEIPALFFSSSGFYCLIKYFKYKNCNSKKHAFYLALSAGLFFCMFFTRITGFMYIPFFYLMLVSLIDALSPAKGEHNKNVILYSLFIFVLFSLSVAYGLKFSFPYSVFIYKAVLPKLVFQYWQFVLLGVIILGGLLLLVLRHRSSSTERKKLVPQEILFKCLPLLVGLVTLIGLLKGGHHWYKGGCELFFTTSFPVIVSYLSPMGFIVLLFAVSDVSKRRDVSLAFLTLFVAVFMLTFFLKKTVPYQYYYARYFLTEIIPFSLLIVSIYLSRLIASGRSKRTIAILCVIAISIYYSYFSFAQFRGREADGASKALKKVEANLDEKDFLFIAFRDDQITTPMQYYYNLNTYYGQKPQDLSPRLFESIASNFNDLFVLSLEVINDPKLTPVDVIAYKYGTFEHVRHIPTKFESQAMNLYLYKVQRSFYPELAKVIKPEWSRLTNFYNDKVWSNGHGIISDISYKLQPSDCYIILQTKGWNKNEDDPEKLNLRLLVNGRDSNFMYMKGHNYYFALPKNLQVVDEIAILSSTFIPKSLGINNDTRELGVDVDSIRILGAID